MKREIKFRYRLLNNKPLFFSLDEVESIGEYHPGLEVLGRDQSTGLIDRFDNEIYEGDILDFDRKKLADNAIVKGQYIYAVKWCVPHWEMRYAPMQVPLFTNNARNSVVIGNLYENLDLTKIFVERWLEVLSNEQMNVIKGINELFKLKLFNPQDKTMDDQIENRINQLYQYDEDYISALHDEFEDFPELIDQVWAEKDKKLEVSTEEPVDILAKEGKI